MKLAARSILSLLFIFVMGLLSAQFEIPKRPTTQTSVYDYATLLSNDQKAYLETKLIAYADSTSTQIVVATVPSIQADDINLVAAQWGEQWGIGQKAKENGLLILIARDDRKMAIQVGYGIEPYLTDALSRLIIEHEFLPSFKQGDYFSGIDNGTTAIFQVLNNTYKAEQSKEKDIPSFLFIIPILIGLFLLSKIFKNGGNSSNTGGKGGHYRGPSIFPDIILSGSGRSGWSGSSGGGFGGGFGGGSFGGGGASGSW